MYIDGFNLYYRCLQGTPHKWLDLSRLCALLLPNNEINRICYFTAIVSSRPEDPGQSQRQMMYLRALGTIPNLTIYRGQFRSQPRLRPLANPIRSGDQVLTQAGQLVEVQETEEKGSDVNLATVMLVDGCKRDYEMAVVVSNDSDLGLPIRAVREALGLQVGILSTQTSNSLARLTQTSFYKPIRSGVLRESQFPDVLRDAQGEFHKPERW